MLGQNLNWMCLLAPWGDDTKAANIVTQCSFVYFLLKLFDLLDTVNKSKWRMNTLVRGFLLQIFFVLRKKTKQITFLHCYHHTGMLAVSYVHVKLLSGGGHGVFLGIVNSYVHSIMYGYYLITSMKINIGIFWKKFITQIQMVSTLPSKWIQFIFASSFLRFSFLLWLSTTFCHSSSIAALLNLWTFSLSLKILSCWLYSPNFTTKLTETLSN